MKYVWLLLLGVVLLAGCTSTQPVPTQREIQYANSDEPLFVINDSEAHNIVDNLNLNNSEKIEKLNVSDELTDYVSADDVANGDYQYVNVDLTPNGIKSNKNKNFTIANWNLQIFGSTKANKQNVLNFYDEKLSAYDIIFVQEIRNADQTAFPILCSKFEGYKCNVSQRDGRSSSKEQIGVIYKEEFTLDKLITLPDPTDIWERSPIEAKFNIDEYNFTIYNAHLKPSDVAAEFAAMEDAVVNEGNVMVLGDFNGGCSYYNPDADDTFDSWHWLIGDNQDTTVAKSDCTYDRIIVNDDMNNEVVGSGVNSAGINTTYSDHYIVFAKLEI